MSLNSIWFILFLPIVFGINFLIPKKYRYIWLFITSYFFYISSDWRAVIAIASCTALTYFAGRCFGQIGGKKRKILLIATLSIHVCILCVFRYVTDIPFVPAGMSFYVLQACGYLIDVYRGEIPYEKNYLKYGAFIAFFPTVMSGPIQRGKGLLQQISEGRDFDYQKAHTGLYYLLQGYLLKLVLANRLGNLVDFAYSDIAGLPGATLAFASILYAFQLYFDFAGYSLLAIGTGKILGFDMDVNFRQPYLMGSIREFWNRWHISLSSWLRDYIYIPLGGSRKGKLRKCVNLMLTFLVSGLWHGTGLNFLVWGGLHGIYQVVASCLPRKSKSESFLRSVMGGLFGFALVDFAWIFFRADSLSDAMLIVQRIFFQFNLREMTYYGTYRLGGTMQNLMLLLFGIVIVMLVDLLHERGMQIESFAMKKVPVIIRWVVYVALTFLIVLVTVQDYGQAASTFIYTRF